MSIMGWLLIKYNYMLIVYENVNLIHTYKYSYERELGLELFIKNNYWSYAEISYWIKYILTMNLWIMNNFLLLGIKLWNKNCSTSLSIWTQLETVKN